MSLEIERKFLVKGDFKSDAHACLEITQGYLSSVPQRSVRVRIADTKAFMTIKGIGNGEGTTRFEWEKEILVDDAIQLMELCEPSVIEKVRYLVEVGKHTFEVDEFGGENEGLIVAEIELKSENEYFEKPSWLGEEITGIEQYYNAALSNLPFKKW